MAERKVFRETNPTPWDVLRNLGVVQVPLDGILAFCIGCDHFVEKTIRCDSVDEGDQARYVTEGYCGWALVDKKQGSMTDEGFIPCEKLPH